VQVVGPYSITIEIARPVNAVFAYMDNFAYDHEWRAQVLGVRKTSPGPTAPGTMYMESRRIFGRHIEAPAVMHAYEQDRLMRFGRPAGALRPQVTYTLEPTSTGGTRLHFDFRVEVHAFPPLFVPLAWLLVQVIGRVTRPDVARLKRRLETA